jgi:uncharacterized protein YbaR (Trm112 family)
MELSLKQRTPLDVSAASLLACPACLGDLRLDDAHLVCAGCGRGYPIVGGIPVLIAGHAKNPPG